jgi:uncharacterized protein (TIGR03382 family)
VTLLLLLLSLPAGAVYGVIDAVGPAVEVGVDGRHGRPFRGPDGRWHLGHGRSGSFHDVALNDDLTADPSTARIWIDGGGRFVDHGLARCPDGGLLHAASGNVERPDDSAWVTAISPDLEPGPTVLVVDRDPLHVTNDMAVLCEPALRAVAFAGEGDWDLEIPQRNWLHVFDDAALAGEAPPVIHPIHEAARVNGTSMVWDARSDQLALLAMPGDGAIQATFYDRELAWVSRLREAVVLPEDRRAYWSAGALPLGAGFAVVHLARRPSDGFNQDQGDVVLSIFGPDLFAYESVMLTQLTPPEGAMRPALALDGDELVVAWDREGRFFATRVTLDLSALDGLGDGVPQDTAAPDFGGDPPDATRAGPAPAETCGAAPGAPSAALALLAVAAVRRRRCA